MEVPDAVQLGRAWRFSAFLRFLQNSLKFSKTSNMKEFAPGWRGRSVGGFSTSGRGNPESAETAGALCLLKVKVAPESESES